MRINFIVGNVSHVADLSQPRHIAIPERFDGPQLSVFGAPPASRRPYATGDFVGDVNAKQVAANDAVSGLMSGKNVSLHQAMISMEEASVSFQMMVEVRNKLLDSYQELMRMQI